MVFKNATVFAESDNLVILDVAVELPKHRTKIYSKRDEKNIDKVIYHHSAGNNKKYPYDAIIDMSYFFISPAALPYGRNWPGFTYHFYIPFSPEKNIFGGKEKFIIYKTQDLNVVSNHTKTQNNVGVAVCFQGDFSMYEPSDAQKVIAEDIWNGVLKSYLGLDDSCLFGHADFLKPSCPGRYLTSFVRSIRGKTLPEFSDYDWQYNLVRLGYDLGSFGPQKDGIDGSFGKKSEDALLEFKKKYYLPLSLEKDIETKVILVDKIREKFGKEVSIKYVV